MTTQDGRKTEYTEVEDRCRLLTSSPVDWTPPGKHNKEDSQLHP